jgi:hypothetical protein
MKPSRYAMIAVAAAALAAIPGRALRAQQMEPSVHFGAFAGLDIPLSNLSKNAQTGFTLGGMAEGTPDGWPVALRGELAYSSFSGKHHYVAQNLTTLNVNAVLPLNTGGDTPYFIGGLGLNHTSAFAGLASENDIGFNFGGGLKWQLADMSTFVELRYAYVAHSGSSWQMLPLTFGVLF